MAFSRFFNRALSDREKEISRFIQQIFGKNPADIKLYTRALRHKSAAKNIHHDELESNERMEFLGDTILDAAVAHYLFEKYPEAGEGELTKMKSRIVSRSNLNKIAAQIGILNFLETDQQAAHTRGSIAGNALEALVGALYLDRGYKATQKSIMALLGNINLKELEDVELDFKSRLFEEAHKLNAAVRFDTRLSETADTTHLYTSDAVVDGVVKGTGKGTSKKRAEQAASEKALHNLNL